MAAARTGGGRRHGHAIILCFIYLRDQPIKTQSESSFLCKVGQTKIMREIMKEFRGMFLAKKMIEKSEIASFARILLVCATPVRRHSFRTHTLSIRQALTRQPSKLNGAGN